MSDHDGVRATVERVVRELGPVDVLVNAAGIVNNLGSLADTSRAAWARELAANLSGAFACVQACVPGMAARGWGTPID